MTVLVDTSVWIDFFAKPPRHHADFLETLLSQDLVATCQPIKAELLSGWFDAKSRLVVERTLNDLPALDLNLSLEIVWQKIIGIAHECQKKKMKIPGIVDRMIILAALEFQTTLWTHDKSLKKLAVFKNCNFEIM